jgi:Mg-chelatase subunit ChlD
MKTPIYSKIVGMVLLLAALGMILGADEREDPVDIIIALDKSLSMEEEIEAVKEYVNTRIVDQILQEGDFFLVISFFGEAPIAFSDFVRSEGHKEDIKQAISSLEADGRFTDIGNALDKLREEVNRRTDRERRKSLLLITDGKHEPPGTSKYYSEDGSFSHDYLQATSETQKEGWKIIVLGVGTESARALAEELAADYAQTEKGATVEEIEELVPDLAGVMEAVGEAEISPVGSSGRARLMLSVETSLYRSPQSLEIQSIGIEAGAVIQRNLLSETYGTELPAEGIAELEIPLVFTGELSAGTYSGILQFDFGSKEHFQGQLPVTVTVKSFIQNFYWIIPVAVVLLAGIAFLAVFAIRAAGGKRSVTFKLMVEEQPLKEGKDTFKARMGKELFLKESMDMIDIADKKMSTSIAQIVLTKAGLSMTPIKMDRFPGLKDPQEDVLGKGYTVRTTRGKDFHVTFIVPKS